MENELVLDRPKKQVAWLITLSYLALFLIVVFHSAFSKLGVFSACALIILLNVIMVSFVTRIPKQQFSLNGEGYLLFPILLEVILSILILILLIIA
ncbi:hypothetical protein L0B53_13545 [Vibrio sp. SS-MA-C1-2]|uniref:hypothetical protein n=1 Tax=Vibrio sp. SS-MA-C1-2 TaxID=2908646 RepID=UPI001F21016B|nr:hypothetical protein [Vibrio sp. SS-MA-C1-2]UJF18042.1 hypothetical protein L0B53_13545 [Vibrio sp. SS-MA-C1-2]